MIKAQDDVIVGTISAFAGNHDILHQTQPIHNTVILIQIPYSKTENLIKCH